MIQAIRINCIGEHKSSNNPQFEALKIPASHDIFKSNKPWQISRLIRLPLLLQSTGPDIEWSGPTEIDGIGTWNNKHSGFLMKIATSQSHRKIPDFYASKEVGSVLVVRQDKKDLLLEHLEVLIEFCESISTKTLENLEKKDFEGRWEIVKGWNGRKSVVSPYDV